MCVRRSALFDVHTLPRGHSSLGTNPVARYVRNDSVRSQLASDSYPHEERSVDTLAAADSNHAVPAFL